VTAPDQTITRVGANKVFSFEPTSRDLRRLVAALPELKKNEPAQSALNELFKLAQSVPDFDPKQFSAALANQP
jgi:hypothetical protein